MKTDRLLADTKTIRYEETDLVSLISVHTISGVVSI